MAFVLCAWMLCGCGATKEGSDMKSEDTALRFIPFEELDAQGYGECRALID